MRSMAAQPTTTNRHPTRRLSPGAGTAGRQGETRRVAQLKEHSQAGLVPEMRPREYEALLADIGQQGITTPPVVTHRGVVLDGRHRLRAARQVGLAEVPVRVAAPNDEVDYLVCQAVLRRHLSASQVAGIVVQLPAYHEALAESRDRQHANLRRVESATLPAREAATLDGLAQRYGVGVRTLQDAHTIATHNPSLLCQVVSGQVPAHRAASRIRRALRDAGLDTPPLPPGVFDVILADPPWSSANPDAAGSPEQHYPTMTIQEICAYPVPAADNAILFLWALNGQLPEALHVITAWEFTYKTILAWDKQIPGRGVWAREQHELLIIATRGCWPPPDPTRRCTSVISERRRRHSQKPEAAYRQIEHMYPQARRLELFARTPRPGWTASGNQLHSTAQQQADANQPGTHG